MPHVPWLATFAVPQQCHSGMLVDAMAPHASSTVFLQVNKQSVEQRARTARQLAGQMSESIRKADAKVPSLLHAVKCQLLCLIALAAPL